jgi:hypothetical protein
MGKRNDRMTYTPNKNLNIGGTYFQRCVKIAYQKLVTLFGDPGCFDGYKTDAEWIIQDSEGRIFTIYNYKNGKNYCGRRGTPVEKIIEWNIGGYGPRGIETLISFLETE